MNRNAVGLWYGPTGVEVGLDDKQQRSFILYADELEAWKLDHPKQEPPAGMHFENRPLAYCYDPTYALWICNLGNLAGDLGRIKAVLDAPGGMMEKVAQIKEIVGAIMGFMGSVDEASAALDLESGRRALQMRQQYMAAQKSQQKPNASVQKKG